MDDLLLLLLPVLVPSYLYVLFYDSPGGNFSAELVAVVCSSSSSITGMLTATTKHIIVSPRVSQIFIFILDFGILMLLDFLSVIVVAIVAVVVEAVAVVRILQEDNFSFLEIAIFY